MKQQGMKHSKYMYEPT